MADQAPRQSRRIQGLSPESSEPSSRRRRSDLAGGYHPVTSNAVERDPPQESEGFIANSGIGFERSVPLTSRVLFLQEEDFQIEEVPEPLVSLPAVLLGGALAKLGYLC